MSTWRLERRGARLGADPAKRLGPSPATAGEWTERSEQLENGKVVRWRERVIDANGTLEREYRSSPITERINEP